MFEIESHFAQFLWPVLCHSLWSIPLISLLGGFRIETISPSQRERLIRFAILACIVSPFVIAVAMPTPSSISSHNPNSYFEIATISSSVTRDDTFEDIRPSKAASTPVRSNESSRMISLETIVSTVADCAIPIWLAGMAVLAVRLIAGCLIFRLRSGFEPADPKSQSIANDLAGRIGLRNPPVVRVSKSVDQPMVMGLWKPCVVLPQNWNLETHGNQLEAVFAHELAHIRRGDLWYVLIERVAGIVWFFHPAMHSLNRQAALWREMAADRMAMEVTGDPLALARALESAATRAGGMPRLSPFESIAITFASPRCRGRLGMRIEALLGPEGVCPVKISKTRLGTYLVLSFAFAFMATKLAAIGQVMQASEKKPTGKTSSAVKDSSVDQAGGNSVQPVAGKIWIGRMNRISSKSLRESKVPAPNPNMTFEVRLVSVSGKHLDGFLDEKFATLRTADDHKAWIVDLEPVLNAANSVRRKLIHLAPKTTAADGEPLNFTFTMPVTTVKYHPINEDGKVRAVKPLPQTTEYDIYSRVTGMSGPQATFVEIKGLESMPRTIEKVVSPIQVERPNLPPHGVSETVVTSQSDSFEASAELPQGKSLIIKLGRTIEEIDDNLVTAAFQLANPKLWNKDVYPYKAMQRYLIITPTELP